MTRLLLVDDSELIRRGLRMLLSTADGLQVVGEAGDGEAALAMIDEVRPDVIVSDLKMPKRNGVELVGDVARAHPGLPVLLLTTFDDQGLVQDAVAAGAAGFLLKDSSTDELVSAIRAVAGGGLALDPRVARAAVAPRSEPVDALAGLTRAEREVAALVATGATNAEIASQLFITEGTAKNHVSALLRKLGARDRTALALQLSRALNEPG